MKIYLAGPMPTQDEWRSRLEEMMPDVTFFNPDEFENTATDCTIVNFDKAIIKRADLVVANITRLSAGTSMEIMFAFDNHIPVILIGEEELIGPWHRFHTSHFAKSLESVEEFVRKYQKTLK